MDNRQGILREWLATKLEEAGHGSKSQLAEYMAIYPNAISRMLKSPDERFYRLIKADELSKMIEFFGEAPPGFNPPLSEEREELFSLYDSLSLKQQAAIMVLLRAFVSAEKQD